MARIVELVLFALGSTLMKKREKKEEESNIQQVPLIVSSFSVQLDK